MLIISANTKIRKQRPLLFTNVYFLTRFSGGVEFLGWVSMATFLVVFLISVLELFCGLSVELP